jgi:endonuclease YncB( thermonuclease family)
VAPTDLRYTATIATAIDGDTLVVDVPVDLWHLLQFAARVHVRLRGINAREHSDPGGPEARAHLASLAPPGTLVEFTAHGPDKFATRVLGSITLPDGTDLADRMVADGYAAPWGGRGDKPVPPWPLRLTAPTGQGRALLD